MSATAMAMAANVFPILKCKVFLLSSKLCAFYVSPHHAGRLFVGSEDGTVYALDSATGCLWWNFRASTTVKTAISIGNHGTTAFFGDTNGNVYALKSADGSVLWKVHPDTHPALPALRFS